MEALEERWKDRSRVRWYPQIVPKQHAFSAAETPAILHSGSLVQEVNVIIECRSRFESRHCHPWRLASWSRPVQRAHDPPSLHGRVGAWKRQLPARSSPAGSSVSLFFLGFFFPPSSLASFSSRLRNPGQTAAFSNPSRPPGAQRASPLPRPAPRPQRRPEPGRPHAVVLVLNLPASVGEGGCRPHPIGGAG